MTGFFSAQKLLDGNAVSFCQLQNLLAASDIPASFPIHQGGPGNAALLGRFFLRQPLFFAQEQQPGSVGVPARLWFSTHARKVKSRPCRKLYFDDISSKIILRLRSVTDALEMCEMNRAATAARREMGKSTDGEIILQLFLEIVRPVVVRVRQSGREPSLSRLWQFSSMNPVKCSHSHAQLHQRICNSNQLFPPIPLGSNEPVCGKGGFAGQRFGGMRVAQPLRKQEAGGKKTRYMCYFKIAIFQERN